MSGKRYSRQRELIYQCLLHTDQHPTAEMIYSWLKPENPNLSLGTVYRNLNLLSEEGIIVRMPFPVERYDLEGLEYDHGLDEEAARCSGHEVERHEVVFSGICTHCVEKH